MSVNWQEVVAAVEKLAEENAALQVNNEQLRGLLWLHHGCASAVLYGDDGEMQCGACGIDFRRLPAANIAERFRQRGMDVLARHLATLKGGG